MRERAQEPTVEDLVAAVAAGERGAWDRLVERFDGLVRAVVARFRFGEADAADAAQMAWLRAVEQIGALRDPERFGGWLRTITFRECIALRGHQRRECPDDEFAAHLVDPTPGPEATLLRAEMRCAVRAAVDTLTERNRTVVEVLFYRPGPDYAHMARELDMPPGSIGPTRGRALQALRTRLERGGYADAA